MTEKPILFSGEMVLAILAGTKTQTRRIVKEQPAPFYTKNTIGYRDTDGDWIWSKNGLPMAGAKNRFGIPCQGNLWVKETWKPHCEGPISEQYPLGTCVKYRADGAMMKLTLWTEDQGGWCEAHEEDTKWRPSIFMPRWASRITLAILDARVEKLHKITPEDAKAEGVASVGEYSLLWEKINGDGSWKRNPWVWVVAFKKISNAESSDLRDQPKP